MKTMWALIGLGLVTAGCNAGEHGKHSKVSDAHHHGAALSEEDEDDDDEGGKKDQDIALADLPANVRAAAMAAFSGLVLESAELETEDGVEIYSVEGTANGVKYCIEISKDGKVLKTEQDDEEDEEEDH